MEALWKHFRTIRRAQRTHWRYQCHLLKEHVVHLEPSRMTQTWYWSLSALLLRLPLGNGQRDTKSLPLGHLASPALTRNPHIWEDWGHHSLCISTDWPLRLSPNDKGKKPLRFLKADLYTDFGPSLGGPELGTHAKAPNYIPCLVSGLSSRQCRDRDF